MGTYMIFSIIFVTLLMAFQANFYFDSVLGKSRRKPRRAIYFMVFLMLGYFYLVSSFSDIISTAVALLLIFSLAQSYEVEFKIKLVFTILYAVLITMANTIAVYILGVLESTEFISWEQFNGENHWILSKVMLVGCSIMFIVIQIVRLVAKRRSFAVHYRYYLLFLIVPIITIYQINVASIYSEKTYSTSFPY